MNNQQPTDRDGTRQRSFPVDRRQFLKILGGGLVICFSPILPGFEQDALSAGTRSLPRDFNAFLRIGHDGKVTCFTGKIEMGQGIVTSLAQMLADELDVPLASVHMVMGDTDLCPWDAGTYGSMSTKYFGPPLRAAAAEARGVLIQLAAEHLHVPLEQLETGSGEVFDRKNPRKRVAYATLTMGQRIERHLDKKPDVKPLSKLTLSGKPERRTDAVEKVTGMAKFAGDIRLPGMLYARVVRPPAHGATLIDADTSAAEKVKGTIVVRDKDLIAVLNPSPDAADEALGLVKARFHTVRTGVNHENIFEHLEASAPESTVVAERGDLQAGRALASEIVEKTYYQGYVAHAPMETHTACAQMIRDRMTVWASTQRPFAAQEEVAGALNMRLSEVHVVAPFVGGGFGGKSRNRQAIEAARLAKLTSKPVQVMWSRKEEFYYDSFQPAAIVKIAAGLNASHDLTFWDYHVYFAGGDKAPTFYDVPHQCTTAYGAWTEKTHPHPFAVGPWRGPNGNTNTFARESHMDALAAAARMDPLAFRVAHLTHKRVLRVIEAVEKVYGWSSAPAPTGKGRGMACLIYKGTCVAAMGDVEVDRATGRCHMKRIVCAQDMGQVVNPEGAKMQMEGCLTMGLGYALSESLRFRDGEILDTNFDTYQIPRFSSMPKIETILVDNPDLPPQEGGEPAITCMGGLVANAIFDAIGIRFTQLPITRERVTKALADRTSQG